MTTGLKADLFLCPECGKPLGGTGKFKTLPKPTRTMRELECGHFVLYEKRPTFRRDPFADRKVSKREHVVNPETDRCVMCGRNRFNRTHTPNCDYQAKGAK